MDYLCATLYTDDPSLLSGYLAWNADVLGAREAPTAHFGPALDVLAGELRDFPGPRA